MCDERLRTHTISHFMRTGWGTETSRPFMESSYVLSCNVPSLHARQLRVVVPLSEPETDETLYNMSARNPYSLTSQAPVTSAVPYIFNIGMRDSNNITSSYNAVNFTFSLTTYQQCVSEPDCQSQVRKLYKFAAEKAAYGATSERRFALADKEVSGMKGSLPLRLCSACVKKVVGRPFSFLARPHVVEDTEFPPVLDWLHHVQLHGDTTIITVCASAVGVLVLLMACNVALRSSMRKSMEEATLRRTRYSRRVKNISIPSSIRVDTIARQHHGFLP